MSEPPVSETPSTLAPDPEEPASEASAEVGAAAGAAGVAGASRADDDSRGSVSLGARLRQPRTILSIAIPVVILVLIARFALNIDFQRVLEGISRANPVYLLAGFVVFYIGFPLRGFRWALLLRSTGQPITVKDSTEILYLSWLVNCLVPAKLGDVYRAYLLKINSNASLSRTFGTVFIERILDLFVIAILGLLAGFWSFRSGLPPEIQFVAALGVGVVIVLAVLLLSMRNFGRRIIVRLPLPPRVLELYDKFEEGVFGAITFRQLPPLVLLTGVIWMTEGLRLYFVVQALGFPDVSLGLSGAVFVALIGSLLTAVPFSPAGLGVVDAGMGAVLILAYGVPGTEAATIVLLDRVISVFSIIVFGSILYIFSGKRKGEGLAPVNGVPVPMA